MNFKRTTSILLLAPLVGLPHLAGCRSAATAPPPQSAAAETAPAKPEPREHAPAPAAPRARPIDRGLALATFDEAWSIVERTHFDPEYNGVDWHAVRDEMRPKAEQVETMSDLRRLVQQMVGRLGQSHFGLLPGDFVDALDAEDEAAQVEAEDENAAPPAQAERRQPRRPRRTPERPSDVGIDTRLVDDQVVITSVKPGSPADQAGIGTGWVVTAIGPREMDRLLALAPDDLDERMRERYVWQAAIAQLEGEEGSTVALTLLDQNDAERVIELQRVPVAGERIKFGDLPTFYASLTHERIAVDHAGATVGYIAFNIWMVPMANPFAQAVDALRDTDGIIIDLRGNPGGVGGMVMGIAGHFLDERLALGTMSTRDTELNFVANPRRVSQDGRRVSPYAGPLAILVDAQSGSTSEIFAAGLQALGRAKVFGETTMGAALPAMMSPLPSGDVLMHAIANFVDAGGEEVEGRGVVPDVYAPPSREQLLAGRDVAREAAIEWIVLQRHEASSR